MYHSLDVILNFIEKDIISKYAYILHDHDGCIPHYHCLLVFKQNVSLHFISKNLDLLAGCHQNTLGEIMCDRISMFEYLTHSDAENDKYVYDDSCVHTNAIDYFSGSVNYRDNVAYQIVCDIINRRPLRELARNYGRDLIINYSRYKEFADMIRCEEPARKLINVDDAVLPFQDNLEFV